MASLITVCILLKLIYATRAINSDQPLSDNVTAMFKDIMINNVLDTLADLTLLASDLSGNELADFAPSDHYGVLFSHESRVSGLSGKEYRYCKNSERQVVTVDNNQAKICCISTEANSPKRCTDRTCLATANHCCQTNAIDDRFICTGVSRAQPTETVEVCQKNQQTYTEVNNATNTAKVCCVSKLTKATQCDSRVCQTVKNNCCVVKGSTDSLCPGFNDPTQTTANRMKNTGDSSCVPGLTCCASNRQFVVGFSQMTRTLSEFNQEIRRVADTMHMTGQNVPQPPLIRSSLTTAQPTSGDSSSFFLKAITLIPSNFMSSLTQLTSRITGMPLKQRY